MILGRVLRSAPWDLLRREPGSHSLQNRCNGRLPSLRRCWNAAKRLSGSREITLLHGEQGLVREDHRFGDVSIARAPQDGFSLGRLT